MDLGTLQQLSALALVALLPLGAVEVAKAARWSLLCGPYRPPFLRCLRALATGQMTNALAPVRAGEVVSVGLLTFEGGALVPSAAALAGAKAIDALILAVVATLVVGDAALREQRLPLIGAIVVLLLGAVFVLRAGHLRSWIETAAWARKIRLHSLLEVAEILKDRNVLLLVALATIVVWVAGLLANAVLLAAVDIPVSLDLASRILVAGYLVGLLPAPPARLGVFEGGIAVALTSGGVPLPAAILAAFALHVCQLVELALLMGASFLAKRWAPASA